jgi:predicted dinucleotide-binding enzyme
VAALGASCESHVGFSTTTLADGIVTAPMRVMLLGLGTVGGGVWRRLVSMPEHFRVVSAFVRSRSSALAEGVPLTTIQIDEALLRAMECDVVVDALPGLEPSRRLVTAFLRRGIDVVSANKVIIADAGPSLSLPASRHNASLLEASLDRFCVTKAEIHAAITTVHEGPADSPKDGTADFDSR